MSLSMGGAMEITAIDAQAAMSLTDHVALMANYALVTGGNHSTDRNWGNGSLFEGGMGYFRNIGQSFVFELYGGAGGGSEHHQYSYYDFGYLKNIYDGTADISFSRLFLQPSVGCSYKWLEGAFSMRLCRMAFNRIDDHIISSGTYGLDVLENNKYQFFLEPAFTLRGGGKELRLQVQYVFSENLTSHYMQSEKGMISFGLYLSLGKKIF